MSDIQAYEKTAREVLETLLRYLEFGDAKVTSTLDDDAADPEILFNVETEESGRLIGRTSSTLDALQFLLNRLLSRTDEKMPYCVVDTAGYRARRREKLVEDALAALEQVRSSGRAWRLPLLNAMDRRVVHHALREYPDVETHSEDEDRLGRKRIVISPVAVPETAATESVTPADVVAEEPAAAEAPAADEPAPEA